VHAGQAGWILTAKLAFFAALGFARFVGKSRPASRRYRLLQLSSAEKNPSRQILVFWDSIFHL